MPNSKLIIVSIVYNVKLNSFCFFIRVIVPFITYICNISDSVIIMRQFVSVPIPVDVMVWCFFEKYVIPIVSIVTKVQCCRFKYFLFALYIILHVRYILIFGRGMTWLIVILT